jgi:hypothetical protein
MILGGLWVLSNAIYSVLIWVVNLKNLLETQYVTWINLVAAFGSILFWFVALTIATTVLVPGWTEHLLGTGVFVFVSPNYYLIHLLVIVLCLLPDVVFK